MSFTIRTSGQNHCRVEKCMISLGRLSKARDLAICLGVIRVAKIIEEFHDFAKRFRQPIGTVLVTRVNCTNCDKPLVLDKTSHPVFIYHTYQETHIGEPPYQMCLVHEHWTIQKTKMLYATTLQQPFLLPN